MTREKAKTTLEILAAEILAAVQGSDPDVTAKLG